MVKKGEISQLCPIHSPTHFNILIDAACDSESLYLEVVGRQYGREDVERFVADLVEWLATTPKKVKCYE